MNTTQHLNTLTEISKDLQPWQSRFTEAADILSLKHPFEEKLARFAAEEQQLNIAIMGQVKAGKSSFLNALLFNGQSVLPAAATPKTANLTRISYGDTHALEVEYYELEEWQKLVALAASTGEYEAAKVARELVKMVMDNQIDPEPILQKGKDRIEAANTDELMNILNQYAGNDGQYTPLVKMTHLYLPADELKGYDVVDTPGMNDPVLSRTEKTKQEMTRCDVVFFLSRASQFLDQSDLSLLTEQLPQGGVKHMVLVAGQYDSVIMDDGYNRNSLEECETNVQKRITRRAQEELGKLADQREQAGRHKNAELLRGLTTPILSSTFAHGFAEWTQDQWGDSMKHVHEELTELADNEWNGYQITQTDWQRIGNFKELSDAFNAAKADKSKLIQAQREGILPDAQTLLKDKLDALMKTVEQTIHILNTGDIAKLAEQEKACEGRITKLSSKLQGMIGQHKDQITKTSRDIVLDLERDIQKHDQLRTRTGTETETESYSVSTSKWYNPFSWGSSETRYRTITVNYEYISASDAIEQLGHYAQNSRLDIQQHFNKLLDQKKFKTELRRALLDELQTSSTDFDPAQFRATLENAIQRVELPELNLQIGDPTQLISQKFSGEIRTGQMDELKRQFRNALNDVFHLLSERFNAASKQLLDKMTHIQQNIQQDLTASIHEELEKVRADFNDKQKTLDEYQKLLGFIGQYQVSDQKRVLDPA